MNDREIFRRNLNYYLSVSGKLQKDLADFVGAKTTTVSGWTRGVSYPRADAMEKIALFFGIPTSRLVGQIHDESYTSIVESSAPQTLEARIVSGGMDKLPQEQREQILNVVRAMFIQHPELFDSEEGTKE